MTESVFNHNPRTRHPNTFRHAEHDLQVQKRSFIGAPFGTCACNGQGAMAIIHAKPTRVATKLGQRKVSHREPRKTQNRQQDSEDRPGNFVRFVPFVVVDLE